LCFLKYGVREMFDTKFRFIMLVIFTSVILKVIRSSNATLIIATSLFEISLLYLIYAGFSACEFKQKIWKICSNVTFYVITLIIGLISIAQSYFIDQALISKYSIFDMSVGIFYFGITNIIPRGLVVLALVLIVVVIYLNSKYDGTLRKYLGVIKSLNRLEKTFNLPKVRSVLIILALILVILVPILFSSNFSHPFANQLLETPIEGEVLVDFDKLDSILVNESKVNLINHQITDFSIDLPENHRVLVFVMEEITTQDFEEDLSLIAEEDNFFSLTRDNLHSYTNYYSGNQDSKTSIQAMLYSIFVPYESYKYLDWVERYDVKVRSQQSVLRLFGLNGYENVFSISSVDLPWAGGYRYPWDSRITIAEDGFSEDDPDYLCLHELQYQRACDDLKIFSQIEEVILENDNLFLLQEMVYGHTQTYEQMYGLSPMQYYNNYLMEVYGFLEENELLENTTIIVLADHGSKSVERMNELEAYHIPFFVYNSKFSGFVDDTLYSHVNFKDILLYELGVSEEIVSNDFVYMVGATASNLLGYIESNESYFILDESKSQVVSSEGMGEERILEEYGVFLSYIESFADDSVFVRG
jgi:hypothetical protein